MRSDQQQAINRLAGTSATAFLCAVLCVYPLYIDKFSNLGVTKFIACFTLFLLFLLWLVACTAIGARAPRPRNANAGRDVTLWGVLAFAGTSLISTFTSLSPTASTWGLGGYYGGLMLVLFTAAGYWAVRSYLDLENLDFVFWVLGITTSIVAVLYVLNIFNIDLIGAYADTAVVERAQFFSTLGQKDFNGCFFSVALPIVFYQFLNAKDTRTAVWTGIPAAFGALALAVVDSEALALGIGAAVMVLVCHKNFTTRHLRRAALISAAFFGWAAWMHYMRASVYTQGGTACWPNWARGRWHCPAWRQACCCGWCCLCWPAKALQRRPHCTCRGGSSPLLCWRWGRWPLCWPMQCQTCPCRKACITCWCSTMTGVPTAAWPGALRLAPGRTAACCARLWALAPA